MSKGRKRKGWLGLGWLLLGVVGLLLMRGLLAPVAGELVRPWTRSRIADGLVRFLAPLGEPRLETPLLGSEGAEAASAWMVLRSAKAAELVAERMVDEGEAQVALGCGVLGPDVCGADAQRGEGVLLCRLGGAPFGGNERAWPRVCEGLDNAEAVLVLFVSGAASPVQNEWRKQCVAQACKELHRWRQAQRLKEEE